MSQSVLLKSLLKSVQDPKLEKGNSLEAIFTWNDQILVFNHPRKTVVIYSADHESGQEVFFGFCRGWRNKPFFHSGIDEEGAISVLPSNISVELLETCYQMNWGAKEEILPRDLGGCVGPENLNQEVGL